MERERDERALSTADLVDANQAEETVHGETAREHDGGGGNAGPDRVPARQQAAAGSGAQADDRSTDSGTAPSTGDVAAAPAPETESEMSDHDRASPAEGSAGPDDAEASPLFEEAQRQQFESAWETIQTGFVDEPRRAVERADTLVADLMQRLAASFAQERGQLEAQWDRGDDVSTEDLRIALQRYRSFFGRLLQA